MVSPQRELVPWLLAGCVATISAQVPSNSPPEWTRADEATTRLAPAGFVNLPPDVRGDLERRHCTVPQPFTARSPENAIGGRFLSATGTDWAVLCSVERVSSILVYRDGTAPPIAELARRPDMGGLETVAPGVIGYSRAIAAADERRIREKNRDNLFLPRLEHQGIEDIFIEKGSSIWYWTGKAWLRLSGAVHAMLEKELVDLTLAVASINAWNRLSISMRTEPGTHRPGAPGRNV